LSFLIKVVVLNTKFSQKSIQKYVENFNVSILSNQGSCSKQIFRQDYNLVSESVSILSNQGSCSKREAEMLISLKKLGDAISGLNPF